MNETEEQRLATYQGYEKWFGPKPSIDSLVRSGFYCMQENEDRVKCFSCKIMLRNWKPHDEADKEHLRHSPSCPFLLSLRQNHQIQQRSGATAPYSDSQTVQYYDTSTAIVPSGTGTVQPYTPQYNLSTETNSENNIVQSQGSFVITEPQFLDFRPQTRQIEEATRHLSLSDVQVHAQATPDISHDNHENQPMEISETMPLNQPILDSILTMGHYNNPAFGYGQILPTLAQPHQVSGIWSHSPVDVPNNNHLRGERNRFLTFHRWPTTANAQPRELARAGFYYAETGDVVRCVFCNGLLKDWVAGDEPWVEHKKHYPTCPFICHHEVGNVPLSVFDDESKHMLPTVRTATASHPHPPNVDHLAVRISSFALGVLPIGQTAAQLADAGFYYIGPGDAVRCYSCGGTLGHWEPGDDPWIEHSRHHSHCEYLKDRKGEQFIRDIRLKFPPLLENDQLIDQHSLEPGHRQPQTSSNDNTHTAAEVSDSMLCKICMEQPFDMVFQPCGHLVCCQHCAPGIISCPICRQSIQSTIKVFLS